MKVGFQSFTWTYVGSVGERPSRLTNVREMSRADTLEKSLRNPSLDDGLGRLGSTAVDIMDNCYLLKWRETSRVVPGKMQEII